MSTPAYLSIPSSFSLAQVTLARLALKFVCLFVFCALVPSYLFCPALSGTSSKGLPLAGTSCQLNERKYDGFSGDFCHLTTASVLAHPPVNLLCLLHCTHHSEVSSIHLSIYLPSSSICQHPFPPSPFSPVECEFHEHPTSSGFYFSLLVPSTGPESTFSFYTHVR
jgi:hypothetical protein